VVSAAVAGVDTIAYLQGVHERYNKPVYIADIALHSFSGDNVRNGDIYDVRIPLVADQQEQANEYESLFAVLAANAGPWFLGVSCDSWNRFPLDYNLVARFTNSEWGENIRGKLAENVLREWWTGQRGWAGMQAAASASGPKENSSLSASLTVSPVDLGKQGNLYVAAVLPNGAIYAFSGGVWQPYTTGALPAYGAATLGTHDIPLFSGMDLRAFAGTYILVGYGTNQADLLTNGKYMPVFVVQ
jgi:hypothetical protein